MPTAFSKAQTRRCRSRREIACVAAAVSSLKAETMGRKKEKSFFLMRVCVLFDQNTLSRWKENFVGNGAK